MPHCRGGFEMVYHGYCRKRCRLKWRCPQILNKATDYQYFNSYGRVIYAKSRWDLRFFTWVPRGGKLWKKRYATQFTPETDPLCGCPDKQKKIDYGLLKARVRSDRQWFVRCALTAPCQHLDAWYQENGTDLLLLFLVWPKGRWLPIKEGSLFLKEIFPF
jgi:hypothetical protein